jgi:hypothetical protein
MTITAPSLADAALERIASATAGHEPGQPYLLTREAFSRFWREELCDDFALGADHSSRSDLWVAIASSEARRQFDPGWSRCQSDLFLTTEQSGACQWWYQTTSGTELFAISWRDSEPQGVIHFSEVIAPFEGLLPWSADSFNPEDPWAPIGPEGFYAVVLPAERDQPGRTAWTQIRLAIAGLDYRCWMQEQDGGRGHDEIGAARAVVRAALCPHA